MLAPSELLLTQWQAELRGAFPDLELLVCGGGHAEWRANGLLRSFTRAPTSGQARTALKEKLRDEWMLERRSARHTQLVKRREKAEAA